MTKRNTKTTNTNDSALEAFRDKLNAVTQEQIEAYRTLLIAELKERFAYESKKCEMNDSAIKRFKSRESELMHSSTVKVAIVANVDAKRVNKQVKSNSRLYLYSTIAEKAFADALVRNAPMNATAYHIAKALVACIESNIVFTHKIAIAALDKTQALDASISKLFKRHYHSASTAQAQASIAMTALRSLNIVEDYMNEDNKQAYKLADTEIARAFVEHVKSIA